MEQKFRTFEQEIAQRPEAASQPGEDAGTPLERHALSRPLPHVRSRESIQPERAVRGWQAWAMRLVLLAVVVLAAGVLWRGPGAFPPPAWVRLVEVWRTPGQTSAWTVVLVLGQAAALGVGWLLWVVLLIRVGVGLLGGWRPGGRRARLRAKLSQAPVDGAERPASPGAQAARSRLAGAAPLGPASPGSEQAWQDGRGEQGSEERVSRERVRAQPSALLWNLVTSAVSGTSEQPVAPVLAGPVAGRLSGLPATYQGVGLVVGVGGQAGSALAQGRREDLVLAASGVRLGPVDAPDLVPLGVFLVVDGILPHSEQRRVSTARRVVEVVGASLLPRLFADARETPEQLRLALRECVLQANLRVYSEAEEQDLAEEAWGTTLTIAVVEGMTATVASIGNCRAYVYHPGDDLLQVTFDHAGAAPLGPAPDGQRGGQQVYRSLGREPLVDVDFFAVDLEVGDLLLLCSDGYWQRAEEARLEQTLQWFAGATQPDPLRLCSLLREMVLEQGAPDHFSFLVVQAVPIAGSGEVGAWEPQAQRVHQGGREMREEPAGREDEHEETWVGKHLAGLVRTSVFPREQLASRGAPVAFARPQSELTVTYEPVALATGESVGFVEVVGDQEMAYVYPALAERWYAERWRAEQSAAGALQVLGAMLRGGLGVERADYFEWVSGQEGVERLIDLARSATPVEVRRHQLTLVSSASKAYRIPFAVQLGEDRFIGYGMPGIGPASDLLIQGEQREQFVRLFGWVAMGEEERGPWPQSEDLAAYQREQQRLYAGDEHVQAPEESGMRG